MYRVNSFTDIPDTGTNRIEVNSAASSMQGSSITFSGENNFVFIEDGVKLVNSVININGDNSAVYISESKFNSIFNMTVNDNTAVYIGKNNYFSGTLNLVTAEGQNIILGGDSLYSFGMWIRTADAHLIFDIGSSARINKSRSVFVGNHVWLGQQAFILKGTHLGSGSVVGACSVCTGKEMPSNCVFGGNPAKRIKEGIFFTKPCVNRWSASDTEKNMKADGKPFIYREDKTTVDTGALDAGLKAAADGGERMEIIKTVLASNQNRNRFAVNGGTGKKRRLFR